MMKTEEKEKKKRGSCRPRVRVKKTVKKILTNKLVLAPNLLRRRLSVDLFIFLGVPQVF